VEARAASASLIEARGRSFAAQQSASAAEAEAEAWRAKIASANGAAELESLFRALESALAAGSRRTLAPVAFECARALFAALDSTLAQRRLAHDRGTAIARQADLGCARIARFDLEWTYILADAGDPELAREAEDLALRSTSECALEIEYQPYFWLLLAEQASARSDWELTLARLERLDAASVALADEGERLRFRAHGAHVRASAHLDMGLLEVALEELRELEHTSTVLRDDPALATAHRHTLARAWNALEQFERALEVLSDASLEVARLHDEALRAQLLVLRGVAQSELQRDRGESTGPAEASFEQALATNSSRGGVRSDAHLGLADLALRARDLERSQQQLDEARETATGPGIRATIAGLACKLALERGDERQAQEELAAELEYALRDLHDSWAAAPRRPAGLGFHHYGTHRTAYSRWIQTVLALDPSQAGLERALELLLHSQTLGAVERDLRASATVAEVREILCAGGRGVVLLFPGMDGSHVFAIDAEGIEHHMAPPKDELARLASALNRIWTDPPPGETRELERRGRELSSASWKLTRELLTTSQRARMAHWSTCIVIGADLAVEIPFACLQLEPGRWLGLAVPIAELPSAPLGVALARSAAARSPRDSMSLVLVADPNVSPEARERYASARPLDLDDDEWRGLRRGFENSGTLVFEGPRASIEALSDPRVALASVVSIFAHGVYDLARRADGERAAALVLSPAATDSDGVVWCADLERLRFGGVLELLVCGAARGPTRIGDSAAAHMVGAAFRAGATSVLAARIDIERTATTRLIAEYRGALRESGVPAQALLEARRRIAANDNESDPWYWAGLAFHGAAWTPLFEPPARSAPSRAWPIGIGLALLLAVAGAVGVARRRG
jgi:CHAT domain-containing protein